MNAIDALRFAANCFQPGKEATKYVFEASDVLLTVCCFLHGMCWKQAMCFWLFAVSYLECVGSERCVSDCLLFPTWNVLEASDVLLLFPTWNVLEASDVLLTVAVSYLECVGSKRCAARCFLPGMCWKQAMCF